MSDSIYFHFFRQMVGVYMQLCPVASGRNICLSLRSIVLRLLAFYVKYCGTRQEAGVSGGVTIVLTWFWNIFRIFFFVAFLFWPPLISFSYFVFCLPPCTGVSMIFSFLGFFFLFIYLFPPTAATFTIILLVAAWSSLNIIFFFGWNWPLLCGAGVSFATSFSLSKPFTRYTFTHGAAVTPHLENFVYFVRSSL